jgi:8-oxo-dGTP diphosphatase
MTTGEESFLASYDPNAFDRPSLAVDIAVLTVRNGRIEALAMERSEHPDRGRWMIPGGFVAIDESLHDAARRLLLVKAGLGDVFVEQLYTFGDPGRDPRMRIVSVAYYALVNAARVPEGAKWFPLDIPWSGETGGPVDLLNGGEPLPLAFDHADILGMAVKRIRGKLDYTPIGFQLLPERFTLRDLQEVHETVLACSLNKDSFRRKMLATGQLEATGEREQAVGHRPAELYRFARRSAI